MSRTTYLPEKYIAENGVKAGLREDQCLKRCYENIVAFRSAKVAFAWSLRKPSFVLVVVDLRNCSFEKTLFS